MASLKRVTPGHVGLIEESDAAIFGVGQLVEFLCFCFPFVFCFVLVLCVLFCFFLWFLLSTCILLVFPYRSSEICLGNSSLQLLGVIDFMASFFAPGRSSAFSSKPRFQASRSFAAAELKL